MQRSDFELCTAILADNPTAAQAVYPPRSEEQEELTDAEIEMDDALKDFQPRGGRDTLAVVVEVELVRCLLGLGPGERVFEVMWETAPQKTDDFCTNICNNLSSGNIWHSHKFNEEWNLKNDFRKIPAFGSPHDFSHGNPRF